MPRRTGRDLSPEEHAQLLATLGREPEAQGRLTPPGRTTGLTRSLPRSRLALLHAAPPTDGWCRTRRRCATLARPWQTTRGITVSAATRRRGLHERGWVWK